MGCGISQGKYNLNDFEEKTEYKICDRKRSISFNDDSPKFTLFDLRKQSHTETISDIIVDMNCNSKHHEKIYEMFKDGTEVIYNLSNGFFGNSTIYRHTRNKNKNLVTDIISVIKKILINQDKIYNNIFFQIKQADCEPDSMLLDKFYSKYNMTLINIYDVPVRVIIEFDQKKNYLIPKYYETSLVPSFVLFINNRYNVKYVYLVCSCGMMCVPYQIGQVFQICGKSEFGDVYKNDSFSRRIDRNVNFVDFYLIPVCCTCDCRSIEERHKIEDMRRSLPNVYSVKNKLVLTIHKTFCSYDHRDNMCELVRDYKDLFPNQEI